MRKLPLLLAVLLTVAAGFAVRAEEAAPKKDAPKKEEAKKDEAKKDAAAPAATQTLTGDLGANAEGKPVLRVKEEKSQKNYILWPESADVAKTLDALVKKKALADVTGVVAPDGVNVKVSSVTEQKREKGKGGGGKGGGGHR